ncbi:MAG: 16S rRNA (adenine(1518)-N(6)/adenine(1519)-N(6))-dimethyltransferase RsmA [Alphaproteobacteria bacterium]
MKKKNENSLREIIKEYNIRPKKKLGQNFLHDKNIISSIINRANVKDEDIIEIGPGPGILTESILKNKARSLLVIEKDDSFEINLKKIKNNYKDKFDYLINDVIDFDFKTLIKKDYKFISNLPYNISVPFILKMIKIRRVIPWKEMILMIQKEVAERITANIGTKNYGRLSIMVNLNNDVKKLLNVKPSSFIPRPKVDSTVIKISPKKKYINVNNEVFEKIVKVCFSQRRKKVKNNLDQLNINTISLLELSNIDPNIRAENIDVEGFLRISNNYEELIKENLEDF